MISKDIEAYVEAHTDAESELLQRINRDTHAEVLSPRMLSGQLQGRLLALLSRLKKPRRILEIGTYTGYSALCLAEGLTDDGLLITIDVNEELKTRAEGYFNQSEKKSQIQMRIGEAVSLLPELDEVFDIVFIDADKANYSTYFDLVIEKVCAGGLIIADNVLWSGKVTNLPNDKAPDKNTAALLAFNEKVQKDSRVSNLLLPVRDGLMIMQKN
jgi:caffeoyl-CoA O-methyltransferase